MSVDYLEMIARYSNRIFAHGASPYLQKSFLDSLSYGQLYSKRKVVELLQQQNKVFNKALFLGHWHGMLPYLLKHNGLIDTGVGIESSEQWSEISRHLNSDWNWISVTGNANDRKFWPIHSPDIVINTSTEHMNFDWLQFVPPGTHVVVQSTDYEIPEHVNTVRSLKELLEKIQLSQVLDSDAQNFKIYNRFTVFGKK